MGFSLQFSSLIESKTREDRFANLLVRTMSSSDCDEAIELISDSVELCKESPSHSSSSPSHCSSVLTGKLK